MRRRERERESGRRGKKSVFLCAMNVVSKSFIPAIDRMPYFRLHTIVSYLLFKSVDIFNVFVIMYVPCMCY